MTTFPTTSSCTRELSPNDRQYDLAQLSKVVKLVTNGEAIATPPSPAPTQFHLHTFTLHAPLQAPQAMVQYPDGMRHNRESNVFASMADMVRSATEACVPINLSLPTEHLMHLPDDPVKRSAQVRRWSPFIFLPTSNRTKPLIKTPPLDLNVAHMYGAPSQAWDMRNWMHAALALDLSEKPTRKGQYRDDKQRVTLRTGVQITWLPAEGDPTAIQLKLLVTVEVYIDMSLFDVEQPDVASHLFAIILQQLIPAEDATPDWPTRFDSTRFDSWMADRDKNLKLFYECLQPAPDLPLAFDARRLRQPEGMVTRLLPFQTRTLALLLEREEAPIAGEASRNRRQPTGQWTRLHFEGFGAFAFCQLNGRLVRLASDSKGKGRAEEAEEAETSLQQLFDLSDVRGTMLCEEMGLGKTVEAIALISAHRHPLSVAHPPFHGHEPSVVNLATSPSDYDQPEIKSWVDEEHKAFAEANNWDSNSQLNVSEVGATLIVTPQPLLKQWMAEMKTHAPHLRVCQYPGWKVLIDQIEAKRRAAARERKRKASVLEKRENIKARNRTRAKYAKGPDGHRIRNEYESESDEEEPEPEPDMSQDSLLHVTQSAWLDYVRGHDVVITTYQVLGDDLNVAFPAPQRSRRSTAKYNLEERPRSPLVMVEFWRVVMDEVQLQGNQSQAAQMVSLVPRRNSLAMSGTPARNDIRDLLGSLRFLRVPGIDNVSWQRLTMPVNRDALHGLMRALAVRTTKADVSGEFNLPHQTRYIAPVELNEIEMSYYVDTLERQRERLDLASRHGNPDWAVNISQFQSALRTLRQICTHIQVGALHGRNKNEERTSRLQLGRQLMTMEEALKRMRDDHEADYVQLARQQMRQMIRKAQLLVRDESDDLRHLKALSLYERVRDQSAKVLDPARAQLLELVGEREDSIDLEDDKTLSKDAKDKAAKIMAARSQIRETLLILHQAWFFEGDVHHVEKEVEKEVESYANAEGVRKEILARPTRTAEHYVQLLLKSIADREPIGLREMQTADTRRHGGIHSDDTITEANALLKILNDNAVLVVNWRQKCIDLLQSPLEAEEETVPKADEAQDIENPDEEHYAAGLKAQGEFEAYLTAYASAIADRKEMLSEERTLLAEAEGKTTKKRTTIRAALAGQVAAATDDTEELLAVLNTERIGFRDRRKEDDCQRPLKQLLLDLQATVHSGYRAEETEIAREAAAFLRGYIKNQTDHLTALFKELDVMRATFNKRAVYFAHLQAISDLVEPPQFSDVKLGIAKADDQIMDIEKKLAQMQVKRRYLDSIGQESKRDVHEDCAVCYGTSDDKHGVLLPCGHVFCVSCFEAYRKRPTIGKRCAFCKSNIPNGPIPKVRLHQIEEGAEEEEPSQEDELQDKSPEEEEETEAAAERASRDAALAKLNTMPEERQRSILGLDMMGDYGSKINFLIKHLLYYRLTHPTTRHVVFSNWADSLHIVERALTDNHIKFVNFGKNAKNNDVVDKFKNDSTISVFLLHAERESAGLTLTSCGVVHLLEPVLQHSFELQAIGRVDRLGQTQNTNVFCYATAGTVEERILAQGVRNGTSIYLADETEDAKAVASMPNIAHAASHGGDLTLGTADSALMLQLIL